MMDEKALFAVLIPVHPKCFMELRSVLPAGQSGSFTPISPNHVVMNLGLCAGGQLKYLSQCGVVSTESPIKTTKHTSGKFILLHFFTGADYIIIWDNMKGWKSMGEEVI